MDAARPPLDPSPIMQTVICMKWGTLYGPDYVNRLYRGVMRNVSRPTRFVAFTDDATGLDPAIVVEPIPAIRLVDGLKPGPWRKLSLWSRPLGHLSGPVLFLDLDVVVTGPIDGFFDYEPGKLGLIRNWTQARDGIGNSSVMRFDVGSAAHLVDDFEAGGAALTYEFDNEQIYLTKRSGLPIAFWPASWCRSFKHELLPPWPARLTRPAQLAPDMRIAVFTGDPRPKDAAQGLWPTKWYKRFYKTLKPVPWLSDHWY
ncbi:hypothetical protein LGH83_02955 [Lichenihabitans sp. PAMC28606]|uniref:hypothetical protein n=1 Tax=Lichenihabitans sp. PAMC28606 TaxID=2880932 RepID=UPI001D0A7B6A|nr:hypothetical protein [Lichenihabitans sp. PAMC28606]UDL95211.1 hypothetical protein LGH83_02955 [Lichenihabitans sp. PAMC28606]